MIKGQVSELDPDWKCSIGLMTWERQVATLTWKLRGKIIALGKTSLQTILLSLTLYFLRQSFVCFRNDDAVVKRFN